MSTSLAAVSKETRLAHPLEFSTEQTRILAETVAKGCDQNELAFFLNVCKIKRLDPFTGQVHCVKRWDSNLGKDKMSIQVGIDGFRVIAVRSGELAGISEPEFDDEDGDRPAWARVTVYRYGRGDEKIPYTAKARFSEYCQTKKDGTANHMWATKPYIMLGKCAEALALRKAFPDELSGMYSDEEMGQADNETPVDNHGKKEPVKQPQRASETKKQAESQQTTQPAQQGQQASQTAPAADAGNGISIIDGEIEKAATGKAGLLWLSLKNGMLVQVKTEKIDQDMKAGSYIKLRGAKTKGKGDLFFYELLGLIELTPIEEGEVVAAEAAPVTQQEAQSAPMAPDAAQVADEMFGDQQPQGEAVIEDLKKNGHVTTAANLPATVTKPGTIGKKRAMRLYSIASQNKKKTGFTEDNIKKVLEAMYPQNTEQHLSDLEVGKYEWFEKLCTGEEKWEEYLPD